MSDAVVTRLRVPAGARTWRVDAAVLALLAIVIRLPAYLADAHLTYDDGVFGASALLLRDGELPYRDIFSPQGPLFLPLVWLGDLVGLRTANAPRVLALAAGAVVTVATYATGRRITGRGGAILAAGLVTTSGSVLWTTAPVAADGPALALATSAVALAFGYRERPTTARAIAIGVVMGAALCVKVLVLPALIPVGVLLLSRRRSRDVALAVGAAALAGVAATAPWGFDRVWDQYIEYHRGSARISSHTGAARKLVTTLLERDPFVVAAGVLAAVTAVVRRHRPARREPAPPGGDATMRLAAWLLAAWAAAVAAVLILEPAFWRPQLAEIVPPLALLAALRPAPPAALAVAFVAVAPWFLAHVNPILWPDDYDAREAAAVDDLGALPDDSAVITDDPGLAWRAERRVPGDLVDSSIKRIEQGQITTGVIVDTARDDDVCAVLVWHDRYADLPGLGAELERSGYEEAARYGDERVLYTKGECPASSTR